MTGYTSFVTMTKPEARAFLERFLAEMPARMEWLTGLCQDSGGPSKSELDYSAASLNALWAWAQPRFAWRSGYRAPTSRGEIEPRFNPDDLEGPGDLPSWFHHPSGLGLATFSSDTLWLIDALGRYLGESVVRSIPEARWASGATRPKGNMLANQPVVAGLLDEDSPIFACVGMASRVLTPWLDTPPLLGEILEQWRSESVAEP